MSIRIQNIGQRIYHFGKKPDEKILPKQVAILNDDAATKLLRDFPKDIIDIDNIKVAFDQTKVHDFSNEKTPPAPKNSHPAKVEPDDSDDGEDSEEEVAETAPKGKTLDDKMAAALKGKK